MALNQKSGKIFFLFLLFLSFITVIWIDISADATFDSGDGIQHYLISRYSWQHPSLFLDHWGKPFFTLLSSPFAQFGLNGMSVFQGLCAASASYFCFRIAKKVELQFAWILPIFIFFSPIYFAVINTGLTEIFFSCILIFSIWLIFEKKYFIAAFIASLLPFIRVEAFVVLPLIVLVLLIRKQFIALPFLLIGFVIYSAIGFFHYGDLLWVVNQSQNFFSEGYKDGKGDFFHYIFHYEEILGTMLSVLFIAGLSWAAYAIFAPAGYKTKPPFLPEEIFLIYGSLFACLLLNTLSYWMPGVLSNLGMLRYMATLIPLGALISLRGFNLCIAPIKKHSDICTVSLLLISVFVIRSPFVQWYYPFRAGTEEPVVAATGEWLNSFPKDHRICYLHPYLAVVSALDPFDDKKTTLLWSLDKEHLGSLPDSTLIIWDSHYAPQEGSLPLNLLMNDTNFISLKHYKYYLEATPFETWVFMKSAIRTTNTYPDLPELITDFEVCEIDSEFFDFDSRLPEDKSLLTKEKFFSEQTSLGYNSENEFGPVFEKKLSSFTPSGSLKMIRADFEFFPCDSFKEIIPVIEIKDGDKNILWYGKPIKESVNINTWNHFQIEKTLSSAETNENYILKFYFWNKDKKKFFVDDIHLQYFGSK